MKWTDAKPKFAICASCLRVKRAPFSVMDLILLMLDLVTAEPGLSAQGPRWLSWMRRPTGDQEVAGSTPAEVGNIRGD